MKRKLNFAVMGLALVCFSPFAKAVNSAPADADTVTLRKSCFEGGNEIPNCFETMAAVNTWLKTVRFVGPNKPTLVDIGPGTFQGWVCTSSNVTLRGSGRDRSVFGAVPNSFGGAIVISNGCTNLNVQDMTINGSLTTFGGWATRGVDVWNLAAVTSWTNVEIIAENYGWYENIENIQACTNKNGKHMWFSSRIQVTDGFQGFSKAYSANCAQSWFWGSEIIAKANNNPTVAFAIEATDAEIHLYGSDVRLLLAGNTTAQETVINGSASITNGHLLMAALKGSEIHVHGTGLDVMHDGTGTADMLYADADIKSHFHATASGFNIHLGGTGKVKRVAGPGKRIEAPYTWGERTSAPLSTKADGTPAPNGVGTLISRNGADRYTETDCQPTGNCSSGGGFPHDMVYLASCTGLAANQGPWFDMTTKACRQ